MLIGQGNHHLGGQTSHFVQRLTYGGQGGDTGGEDARSNDPMVLPAGDSLFQSAMDASGHEDAVVQPPDKPVPEGKPIAASAATAPV